VEALLGDSSVRVLMPGGIAVRASILNGDIAPGSAVTLSIRPERVTILRDGQSMPEEADAVVRELTYVGDHLRVLLKLPGTDRFVVKLPNSAEVPSLAVGQVVRVGWRIEDCLVLE